jgi:predicted helicase
MQTYHSLKLKNSTYDSQEKYNKNDSQLLASIDAYIVHVEKTYANGLHLDAAESPQHLFYFIRQMRHDYARVLQYQNKLKKFIPYICGQRLRVQNYALIKKINKWAGILKKTQRNSTKLFGLPIPYTDHV